MAKKAVINVTKFLAGSLRKKGLNIIKIILFGSHARGTATIESDIDVMIVSEDFRNKDIFERVSLIKEAEITAIRKFMLPLDIIALTPEEFENEMSLISEYAKNGEIVYAS